MLTCIAISSNLVSLKDLEWNIKTQINLTLVKSFFNSEDAMLYFPSFEKVDLIFSDFDIINSCDPIFFSYIKQKADKIVIIANQNISLRDISSLDVDGFILSPCSHFQFTKSIQRIYKEYSTAGNSSPFSSSSIFIKIAKEKSKLVKVDYSDILAFESQGHYIKIHTHNQILLTCLTFSKLIDMMILRYGFVQVHRSFIVSQNSISSIENKIISLHTGVRIPIGRNYSKTFLESVKQHRPIFGT